MITAPTIRFHQATAAPRAAWVSVSCGIAWHHCKASRKNQLGPTTPVTANVTQAGARVHPPLTLPPPHTTHPHTTTPSLPITPNTHNTSHPCLTHTRPTHTYTHTTTTPLCLPLCPCPCPQVLTTEDEESNKPFPYPLPLDSNTRTLASIPLPLFYPGVLALAAVAGLAGSTVGKGLPGESGGIM